MPAHRLDPGYPKSVMLGVKLGRTDAKRLAELARQAGLGKSAYARAVLLDALGRADSQPPDEQAA